MAQKALEPTLLIKRGTTLFYQVTVDKDACDAFSKRMGRPGIGDGHASQRG